MPVHVSRPFEASWKGWWGGGGGAKDIFKSPHFQAQILLS